ncbi:MAG: 50S ribosomal protein L3 [Candidatus Micrarchaeota archaeon]
MAGKGPVKGSRAYWHRKRASRMVPRLRAWRHDGKGGTGFLGYKAGMTQMVMVDDSESPLKNQEVTRAATVVEVPPAFVYSIVAYVMGDGGLKAAGESPALNAPKQLKNVISVAKKAKMKPEDLGKIEGLADVRVMACSEPWKASFKKSSDVFEMPVNGADAKEKLEYAKSVLGKELRVSDLFQEGEYLDVTAVTTGRGWQGVVKRFGVALNPRKATKSRRHGGTLGAEKQGKVMYTIPRAGQMGFHRRTERNKRIMLIGDASKVQQVQPKGGFPHFGVIKGDFIVVEGSLPGPAKRVLRFRRSLHGRQAKKPQVKQFGY